MTLAQNLTTVVMPSLGDAVTEATITRWLKSVGDRVEHDEPLLEVATDKVDTEIPAPTAGILSEITLPEDAVVEVGATIAIIRDAADAVPAPEVSMPPAIDPTPTHTATVEPPAADRTETLPRIRRTIAQRMVASLQTAAQLTTVVEVDMTMVARLRTRAKDEFRSRTGHKLSFLPFVVAAGVEALSTHPVINSSLNADCTEVTYHAAVHLGIAVDSDKGLMVPVIRDSQALTITELTSAIADRADAVRSGKIKPDDLAGGTFTITNTGSRGALFDTPIINQPQSAILGVGTVVERLLPLRDPEGNLLVQPRSMAYLSLSYDHRIVDGADAARYLSTVRQRLEAGFREAELR